MTPADTDPRDDQAAAKLRDLDRLVELVAPHLPDHARPVNDARPHITPADRAEVQAILGRVSDVTEDPEVTMARQRILLGLAYIEAHLREILDHGQPRFRNGKMMRDPQTGEPLRNRNIDRSARALLRKVERDRARLAGLPPASDTPST